MTETKEAASHVEATPSTGMTSAELATSGIYHDGVILLDVRAKDAEGGETPTLKLSKDGHVRCFTLMRRAQTDEFADCVGTSAI